MKKLLLFVIACTLGLFGTVNAQNRLVSVTQANEGNNITYVYESETSNKVVRIDKGVYNEEYGSQEVTMLTYDANGLLTKSERVWLWDDTPDYSGEWTVNNYNYTDGVLTSYTEEEWKHWYSDDEPYDVTEYAITRNAQGQLETITDVDGNGGRTVTFSYDEEGRLVKKEKTYYFVWDDPRVDYVDYSYEYAYDAAGNCVTATSANGEVTSYIYDVTKLATDVYCFAYPQDVNPVSTNVNATVTTGDVVLTYNYNFATVAAPIAPTGLTAEVLSDTEVK